MANVLNFQANVLEFMGPGVAHIPPEYMLFAAGLAKIPGAVLPVAAALSVYAGAAWGPNVLRGLADWIDPD